MSKIRLLHSGDIEGAMRLSQAARWNQVPEDWARLIRLQPDGCFGIDSDGQLAATATAVCYGGRLAWIGMVLTHPDQRRQGHARRLMEHALAFLEERRVDWIKLDATEMGRPLYRDLGFEDEGMITRWTSRIQSRVAAPAEVVSGVADRELDLAAFGARRREALDALAGDGVAVIPGEGFAMARPGARAAAFGPCIARSPEVAALLLQWFLSRHSGETVCWDLMPANRRAVRLARLNRFTPHRRLTRMILRGVRDAQPLRNDDSLVYAAAGFEYG